MDKKPPTIPTLVDVQEVLQLLVDSSISREQASDWAHQWVTDLDIATRIDETVWNELLWLDGIDLKQSTTTYLHHGTEIDERLARLRATFNKRIK